MSPRTLLPLVLAGVLPATLATAQTEPLRLRCDLEYRPAFHAREETWDLYVYLDGDLLAWIPRGGQLAPTPPARFAREVSPGPHVVRLAIENHARVSGGWHHEARVSPLEIFFHLEAGADAELELALVENRDPYKSGANPVAAVVRQGAAVVQSLEKGGSPPSEWPRLCEEVEANLEPRRKVPRKVQAQLAGCVRWQSLWKSLASEAPPRDAVRGVLERYDFQPRAYRRLE